MIDRPPLAFSDRQLALLRRAAAALPPDRRTKFLSSVAARLTPEPGDYAVATAIIKVLGIMPTRKDIIQ
jgi:hypothetical protein